jgi:hypothetical protein
MAVAAARFRDAIGLVGQQQFGANFIHFDVGRHGGRVVSRSLSSVFSRNALTHVVEEDLSLGVISDASRTISALLLVEWALSVAGVRFALLFAEFGAGFSRLRVCWRR